MELIVVDDCSDDGSKEFLTSLSMEYNFKYIYIEKESSKGGNFARNCGIQESQGEYIAFLDDDDEWLNNKIECQVNALEKIGNVDIVYCGAIIEFDFAKRVYNQAVLSGDLSKLIWYNLVCTTSQMMIRKSLLDTIGGFDLNVKYWQEHELLIRACQHSEVAVVSECLILYRVSTQDKNKLSNNVKGWEDTVSYIESKHKKLFAELSEDELKKYYIFKAKDGLQRAVNVHDADLKKHYLKVIYDNAPSIKTFIKYKLNVDSKQEILEKLRKNK
jgi:glycosyltransferase involved in cell wall biosynthesis